MAMMMTGRVLLVCALCVLWCGAGGGGCSEAAPVLPVTGVTGNDNNLESKNNTTDGIGGGSPTGRKAATQPAAASVQKVPGTKEESAPKTGAEVLRTAEETIENKDTMKKEGEADRELKDEDKEEGEEDDGGEKKKQEGKDDTSTTKTKSAVGQEEPISPSGTEKASNKTKPQSTQTTGDKDPAADGAGTQVEKQNENKEANPKKTPVEATAMKTTTPTTGDSDGSTAVPHTTSPLLLLLVVSCAAAAVVAA
ncbi:mucin-associated surface protein [Trypanosoma cruzi cruzi]|uniref:Mucin-associated surface protein (MASP) n=1 Tax=Trypanosoma cruzi TaxID=5693 RepID=A0A2V2W4G4_TRYCR|nr:mucin-associated surface protein [Trypanosoma cruzi cruzi]PWV03421.1 Mucin-associated surface protein (MASP) [Trypanosoma cruzi]